MNSPKRFITRKQLREIIPYSMQHIARLERQGKFPKRVALGPGRVGWLADEVQAWIDQKIAARDANAKSVD
jgi:prophage regulatory protein